MPHQITDNHQHWMFLFLIMMPNTAGVITRAIRQNDYSSLLLCISVCVCFFLLHFCLSKYISLPKNDTSTRKFWLKLNMWLLYTAISFGFVYQFADFFPKQIRVSLYSVVSVCSLYLFYVLVIVDVVKYWKIWIRDEDERANWTIDTTGKLKYQTVSIWEIV
ncbi:hypothetical protein QVD17_09744 [Tagetes erecta]|uniref:Uncharacterized protein n=1 Tax=Tagetes erecta TaxID=13708 RepID=A0AAD8P5K6_TARER|nr:hypothetical protein QVD17_09744 [Tagetes erecta]